MPEEIGAGTKTFHLEEATIAELHATTKARQTTCVEIVQHDCVTTGRPAGVVVGSQ